MERLRAPDDRICAAKLGDAICSNVSNEVLTSTAGDPLGDIAGVNFGVDTAGGLLVEGLAAGLAADGGEAGDAVGDATGLADRVDVAPVPLSVLELTPPEMLAVKTGENPTRILEPGLNVLALAMAGGSDGDGSALEAGEGHGTTGMSGEATALLAGDEAGEAVAAVSVPVFCLSALAALVNSSTLRKYTNATAIAVDGSHSVRWSCAASRLRYDRIAAMRASGESVDDDTADDRCMCCRRRRRQSAQQHLPRHAGQHHDLRSRQREREREDWSA